MAQAKVQFPNFERPHTDIGTAQIMLIATGFVVVFFGILYFTPIKFGNTVNFLRDLFLGGKIKDGKVVATFFLERVIFQGVTMWVWALSMANIFLKVRRIRAERQAMAADPIPEDLDYTDENRMVEVYEKLSANPSLAESVGLTRVARVLAMWINTKDFERTTQYAREQSDLDAAASDSSYRRNRLFIWAMPLLGFVGTVFGVAAGIAGFADFLTQSAVTPEGIKQQVGLITEGLAVAFYCTLLGLVTAGLAAFPSLMAERKEEDALSEVEEYVEDRMLSRMPSGEREERQLAEEIGMAVRQSMEGASMHTKFPIEELAQAIDAGFRRLPNPDRYEEVFSRAITKAGDLINAKYDEFAQNYERRVGELGAQLGGKLEQTGAAFNTGTQRLVQGMNEQTQRVAQTLTDLEGRQSQRADALLDEMKRLAQQMPEEFRRAQERYLETQAKQEQKTADRFEELTEQIAGATKEQSKQFAEAHEAYLGAIAELDRKEIARWEKMVAEFNQLSVRLADQFKQSVASLDAAAAQYSEGVQESVQALTGQLQKVHQLGVEIDKVLRTTQTMESTLRQMGSSEEFRQTLSNLRTHLTASDELLKQLSRPRRVVFQETRAED
jgi:biopolymer transport protein ExbB/TolQ